MLEHSYRVLDQLRLDHGLYIASPSEHYRYVWLRDSIYMSLPYVDKKNDYYERAFHQMLDLFRAYEWKLDLLGQTKPTYVWEYMHARYDAVHLQEIHDQSWGHAQHDMTGAFLYGIGVGLRAGKRVLRDEKDRDIVRKLVQYLQTVSYWDDPDNGMWEEWREVHTSSVGACVAGLKAVQSIVPVPDQLIQLGEEAMFAQLPRESASRPVDLALLSLIYPYRLVTGTLAAWIIREVERHLLRDGGVIRYCGDSYYSTLEQRDGRHHPLAHYEGTEAEWTFGLPWLALCHLELGRLDEAATYLARCEAVASAPGQWPELYYSKTMEPNPNTPLGWSSAMYILAREAYDKRLRNRV